MTRYLRVTDDVKPRREYTIRARQLAPSQRVLKKPATHLDGTPIPAKYTPAAIATGAGDPPPASTDSTDTNKEK